MSFNSTFGAGNESITTDEHCPAIYDFYTDYVEKGIAVVGVVGNFVSMLIFMNKRIHLNSVNATSNFNNCSMYKYLALKSLFDCIFLFQIITYSMLECDHDKIDSDDPESSIQEKCSYLSQLFLSNYPSKVFNLISTYYFGFILQLGSMFLEVAATFDRYFMISRRPQTTAGNSRSSHKIVCLLILFYSSLFYVYKPFQLRIMSKRLKSSDSTVYFLASSEFQRTKFSEGFDLVHSLVRDGVCVLVLLIVNIMILVKLRNALNKKRIIKTLVMSTTNMHAQRRKSRKDSIFNTLGALYDNLNKNELRLTIMVVLTGVVNIIGHLPAMIFYFESINRKFFDTYCFIMVKSLLYYLSFSINILFYYFFNKNFSRIFNSIFCLRSQDKSYQLSLISSVPL